MTGIIYRIWPAYVLSDSLNVESGHKLIDIVRVVKVGIPGTSAINLDVL